MSRDDELAHRLLPSFTIKVANKLSSIAKLGALNKLPSIICACTEAPSSKDWWEFPELSDSQSNMAALRQEESAYEWKQRGKTIQF